MTTYSYKASAVEVSYIGATNTKGSRVKITSHHLKKSRIVDFRHDLSDIESVAVMAIDPTVSDARSSAPRILFATTQKGSMIIFTGRDDWNLIRRFFGVKD